MKSRLYLLLIISLALFSNSYAQSSIYSIVIDSIETDKKIHLSSFEGKRILFINASSEDSSKTQYAEIKQLNNVFKDSLIIIVIPSNSFNNIAYKEEENAAFYHQESNNRFPVTAATLVNGNNKHVLFQWLTEQTQNGVAEAPVRGSYQKYLINKQGKLIGVFERHVRPLSRLIIEAIEMNAN